MFELLDVADLADTADFISLKAGLRTEQGVVDFVDTADFIRREWAFLFISSTRSMMSTVCAQDSDFDNRIQNETIFRYFRKDGISPCGSSD